LSDPAPLTVQREATAAQVGAVRREVRRWLAGVVDDPDAADDLVLAVSEAVENVVDHAFTGLDHPGTMTVSARVEGGEVVVSVGDDGRWQEPTTDATSRGRGIAMMESLADSAVVDTGRDGTVVTLVHRLRSAVTAPHDA
jgi:anti-sigma regulatory factor (Ser/Thr protein kinase)